MINNIETKQKAISKESGEFVYGYYASSKDCVYDSISHWILDVGVTSYGTEFERTAIKIETLCQFTGKTIKGVDLYSGDILLVNNTKKQVRYDPYLMQFQIANVSDLHNDNTMKILGDSVWQSPGKQWWEMFENEMEIIGSIHQKEK